MKELKSKEDFEKAGVKTGSIVVTKASSVPTPYIVKELRKDSFICLWPLHDDELLRGYDLGWYYIGESLKEEEEKPKPKMEGLAFMEAMERVINFGESVKRKIWMNLFIKKDYCGKIYFYLQNDPLDDDQEVLAWEDLNATDWEVWGEKTITTDCDVQAM